MDFNDSIYVVSEPNLLYVYRKTSPSELVF